MTNKKTTKRALLMSVVSMLLCVAMLLGTTFAWFTDSVTSGRNQILAGNLDVELYHTNEKVTNDDVKGDTALFVDKNGEAILWEPGVVVYENFTVANVGTLALKYQLDLTVFSEKLTSDGKSLSDVIKVGYVKDGVAADDRDTLVNSITEWTAIDEIADADTLLPATSKTTGVVLYWAPTANDNDYNMNNANQGKELSIEFGITLIATQVESEYDSFGNDYDKNAGYATKYAATASELQTAIDSAVEGDVIAVTADIVGDITVSQPTDRDFSFTIDGNGHEYDGQIVIKGNSNIGNDALTIRNFDFVTETASRDFIWSGETKNGTDVRYAHNVTIEKCTFTASGAAVHTAVGARFHQSYNIKLVDCTATNMHSLLQAESCGSTVSVDRATINNGKNGISLNNTMTAKVSNSVINSVVEGGYGIRHKGEVNGYSLTVKDCTINAFVPVLVRNMTASNYTATFNGTNTLTTTNALGYQVVFSKGDYDGSAAPVVPTGTYTLVGANGFNVFGK